MAGFTLALYAVLLAARLGQAEAEEAGAAPEAAHHDELDQGILESSPLYHCFQQGLFYYNADGLELDAKVVTLSLEDRCVGECPAGTVLAQGQCVRAEAPGDQLVVLHRAWEIEVNCSSTCASFDLPLLHHIRLKVAGYLDITFQEVREVELAWKDSRTLILKVKVETKRLSKETGEVSLAFMLISAATASKILNYDVIMANIVGSDDEGIAGQKLDDENDPFLPAYNHVMPEHDDDPLEAEVLGFPAWAWLCIIAAAFAAGAAIGICCWRLQRRRRRGAAAAAAKGDQLPAPRKGSPGRSSSKEALKDAQESDLADEGSSKAGDDEAIDAAV